MKKIVQPKTGEAKIRKKKRRRKVKVMEARTYFRNVSVVRKYSSSSVKTIIPPVSENKSSYYVMCSGGVTEGVFQTTNQMSCLTYLKYLEEIKSAD